MKHVMPARREMGIRTVFNILGPLTNPAGANAQVIGVYSRELVEPLARVLAELGTIRAFVVHGADGLDEISTTGDSWAAEVREGVVRTSAVRPGGLRRAPGRDRGPPRGRPGGERRDHPAHPGRGARPAARHRRGQRGRRARGGGACPRLQGGMPSWPPTRSTAARPAASWRRSSACSRELAPEKAIGGDRDAGTRRRRARAWPSPRDSRSTARCSSPGSPSGWGGSISPRCGRPSASCRTPWCSPCPACCSSSSSWPTRSRSWTPLWDAIHTVIRPVGGALLASRALGELSPAAEVLMLLLLGGATLATHAAKATTRLAVNASPEPVSNVLVSLAENGLVALARSGWRSRTRCSRWGRASCAVRPCRDARRLAWPSRARRAGRLTRGRAPEPPVVCPARPEVCPIRDGRPPGLDGGRCSRLPARDTAHARARQ